MIGARLGDMLMASFQFVKYKKKFLKKWRQNDENDETVLERQMTFAVIDCCQSGLFKFLASPSLLISKMK